MCDFTEASCLQRLCRIFSSTIKYTVYCTRSLCSLLLCINSVGVGTRCLKLNAVKYRTTHHTIYDELQYHTITITTARFTEYVLKDTSDYGVLYRLTFGCLQFERVKYKSNIIHSKIPYSELTILCVQMIVDVVLAFI